MATRSMADPTPCWSRSQTASGCVRNWASDRGSWRRSCRGSRSSSARAGCTRFPRHPCWAFPRACGPFCAAGCSPGAARCGWVRSCSFHDGGTTATSRSDRSSPGDLAQRRRSISRSRSSQASTPATSIGCRSERCSRASPRPSGSAGACSARSARACIGRPIPTAPFALSPAG